MRQKMDTDNGREIMSETPTSDVTETTLSTVDQGMREICSVLEADAGLAKQQYEEAGMAWITNWFLGQLDGLDNAEQRLKEQFEVLKSQLQARRKALWWNWGAAFQAQVNQDLHAQGGKKRSVDYATGRAGYRRTAAKPVLVIVDNATAEATASILCPEAVTVTIKPSVILKHIAEHGGEEFPGTRVEQTEEKDTFYPKRPEPQLEADDDYGHTDTE